jgi:hypothetical protein
MRRNKGDELMRSIGKTKWMTSAIAVLLLGAGLWLTASAQAGQAVDPALAKRFEFLSKNGNSNCSQAFLDSIPKMPVTARIRGSCCSPMDLGRYAEQTEGLKRFKDVAAIPADPYDIEAGLAQQTVASDDMALSPGEQRAYNYAMAHSEEHGPCCCQCWRWHVYGGLAKYLIHYRGFTGPQVTELWNLSDGCGGA